MKSKFFAISELVNPAILSTIGEVACWRLLGQKVIDSLDAIRAAHGFPIFINGKGMTDAGVRCQYSMTGAPNSRHKLLYEGVTAFDLHSDHLDDLRKMLVANHTQFNIQRMEAEASTPGWCHIEIVETLSGDLVVFNP